MSTTLTNLRLLFRNSGRNANDPTYYTNAFIDTAALRLLSRFLRVTRCVKTTTTVIVTASTNQADFSLLTGFLPDRLHRARVTVDSNYTTVRRDLSITGIAPVMDMLNNTNTGTPRVMGWLDSATVKMFPAPLYDGTLTITYALLQVPWTVGTMGAWSASVSYYVGDVVSSAGSLYRSRIQENLNQVVTDTTKWDALGTGTLVAPASVTSTIPDGLIGELIVTGGPPALQNVDVEHQAFVGQAWQQYLDFENQCRGIGSLAGHETTSDSCMDVGWRGRW